MSKRPDPFDSTWVRLSLLVRAERVAAGSNPADERSGLFDELSAWALDNAERQTRHVPSHADRHEVRSRALVAVWESTQRIDWDRPTAWPSLLKRRLRGALLDAARYDDPLSRRDRAELRRLRAVLTEWEANHGRSADLVERRSLLDGQRADGSRVYERLETYDRPLDLESLPGEVGVFADDRSNPEVIVTADIERASVKRWLTEVVPEPLALQLTTWALGERVGAQLPNRLATRVRPYVGALAESALDDPSGPSDDRSPQPGLVGPTHLSSARKATKVSHNATR